MMRYAVLLASVTVLPALADSHGMPMANPNYTPHPPKKGYSYPDCYCTDSNGRRVELGQTACLHIGGHDVLARCAPSVNVTTWRRIQDGCPGV